MPERHPPPCRGHDLVLVVAVAAAVLGAAMVSHGGLPAPSAAHRVSLSHATPGQVERVVPAPDTHPMAIAPLPERVPTAAMPATASCGTDTNTWACAPRHELDHDLRLELAVMALHRRRIPLAHREQPAGYYGAPWPQDVP